MTGHNYQYIKKINDLISNYIAYGQVSKLDALSQLSQILITDADIISNIDERCLMHVYDGNGGEIVASVKSDMNKIIPTEQRTPWQDFVKFYLRANCQLIMSRHLENAVISCSPDQKQIIGAFLTLSELGGEELQGAVDLTAFFYSCKAAFDIPTTTADKLLVGIGLTNRYCYDSKYISHPARDIPDWVSLTSHDIVQNPEQFGISWHKRNEMERELKQEKAIEFITWLGGKIYGNWKGLIERDEWEKGEKGFENQFGPGSFESQLGILVKAGVISIKSSTGRNFDGFGVYINPDSFILMPYKEERQNV